MLMEGGRQTAAGSEEERLQRDQAGARLAQNDRNLSFSQSVLAASGAEKETATVLQRLDSMIAQGKIVDAVLESAINTDLPGMLRAIVSRDIFAEAGRNVLIHKGSRLIGQYNTSIFRGQQRVFIIWTRVIRPDGIDIQIGSPAIDPLGRAGINGLVDNKYFEIFSSAILTSVLSIGTAVAVDNVIDNPITTTNNRDGSSFSTGSAGAQAATDAVQNLGDIGQSLVGEILDMRPTITIDQGTRISVFVNRDLIFPVNAGGGPIFIQ